MSEQDPRKSPPRLAPRPSVLQHVPQPTIKKTKTRISNACTACQARKTKCDNEQPKCSACAARPNSECVYLPFLDKRKRQHAAAEGDSGRREHDLLKKILNATKHCSKEELPKLLEVIRGETTIEDIANYIQEHLEAVQYGYKTGTSASSSTRFEEQVEDSEMETDATSPTSQRNPLHAMEISSIIQTSVPRAPSQPWTNVTQDDDLVSHLIQLFFTWETPVYDLVEKELFLADMLERDAANAQYCSPFLVNAILATACFYSDHADSTEDNLFFLEAERIWANDLQATSLTSMQALTILHYYEGNRGRDVVGMKYLDAATKMYQELSSGEYKGTDMSGQPLRLSWACWQHWIARCYTSFVLRRPDLTPPPRLPKPSIPIDLDPLDSWQPYPQFSRSYPQKKIELLHQCIGLAEIVQRITRDFYTGKKEISHDLHHRFHAELLIWHDGYRKATSEMEGNIAPDLIIRLFYHSVIIHLFRGIMSASGYPTAETSQMLSYVLEAANASAQLQRTMLKLYSARGTLMAVYSGFQTALATLHFLDVKECREAFVQSTRFLWRLGKKRNMPAFQLWMVGLLAGRERVELPMETAELLRDIAPRASASNPEGFGKLVSKIPIPAITGGGDALRSFREEISEGKFPGYTMINSAASSSSSTPATARVDVLVSGQTPEQDSRKELNPNPRQPVASIFDDIDPAVGSLTELYQQWTILFQ